jgi:hypothetical protein
MTLKIKQTKIRSTTEQNLGGVFHTESERNQSGYWHWEGRMDTENLIHDFRRFYFLEYPNIRALY